MAKEAIELSLEHRLARGEELPSDEAGPHAARHGGRSGRGMSRRLPALKARDVIRALEKAGFVVVRIKGSHHFIVHRDDKTRMTNVPAHASRDLPARYLARHHQAGRPDGR